MNKKLIWALGLVVVIAGTYVAVSFKQPCIDDCHGETREIKNVHSPLAPGWKLYNFQNITLQIPNDFVANVDPNNEYNQKLGLSGDVIFVPSEKYLSEDLSAYIELRVDNLSNDAEGNNPVDSQKIVTLNGTNWYFGDNQIFNEIKDGYDRSVWYYQPSDKVSFLLNFLSRKSKDIINGPEANNIVEMLETMVRSYTKMSSTK
jgi:hypothetical protein